MPAPADDDFNFSISDPAVAAVSSGASVPSVLGGSFDVIRAFVQDEERVIQELSRRSPTARREAAGSGFGDSRGPYRYNGTPMVITTENLAADGRYLVFWSGPSNTQWTFPMRGAEQQTRSGTIYHSWRNGSRSSFFDEPTVSFTFQAGNIMPVRVRESARLVEGSAAIVTSETVSLPGGLLDFYDFFEILNQPKILSDGRPNFVFIAYHSLVYPEIFLRGFFTPEGLSFTDDAQNPAGLTWTSTFKVRSTEPPFWDTAQLISSWRSAFDHRIASAITDQIGATGTLGTTGVPVPGQGDGG